MGLGQKGGIHSETEYGFWSINRAGGLALHIPTQHSILESVLDSLAVGLSVLQGWETAGSSKYRFSFRYNIVPLTSKGTQTAFTKARKTKHLLPALSQPHISIHPRLLWQCFICLSCLSSQPTARHHPTGNGNVNNGHQPRTRPTRTSAASNDERGQRKKKQRARAAIAAAASDIITIIYHPFPIPSDRDLPKMPEEKGTT